MKKDIFVSQIKGLSPGQSIQTPLLIQSVSQGQTVRGSMYLNLELGDCTGKIEGKFWDASEFMAANLKEGLVFLVDARLDVYKGRPQLNLSGASPLEEGQYEPADFFRMASLSVPAMKSELMELVQSFGDRDFQLLVTSALNSPKTEAFWTLPAAKVMHHAYFGGLLEHSLSVAKHCSFLADHYSLFLRRDLLLAGAILHDVGKCWELSKAPASEYTSPGRLLGHLSMGTLFLADIASSIDGFPQDKLLLLEHLLLSHHGEEAKGSPVTPKILEAVVLHYADELDARVNSISGFIETETAGREGAWTSFHKRHNSYYMATPKWLEAAVKEPSEPVSGGNRLVNPDTAPEPKEWPVLPPVDEFFNDSETGLVRDSEPGPANKENTAAPSRTETGKPRTSRRKTTEAVEPEKPAAPAPIKPRLF